MTRTISIDRRKPLAEEPRTGHNRWHPDIEPIVEVGEGEDVTLETRDACDGHLTPRSTVADLATLPVGAIHPLTGPVAVKGARPGDLLEIEFREIVPQPWAFSGIIPGLVAGSFDLTPTLNVTAERAQRIAYTIPTASSWPERAVRSSSAWARTRTSSPPTSPRCCR